MAWLMGQVESPRPRAARESVRLDFSIWGAVVAGTVCEASLWRDLLLLLSCGFVASFGRWWPPGPRLLVGPGSFGFSGKGKGGFLIALEPTFGWRCEWGSSAPLAIMAFNSTHTRDRALTVPKP